MKPQCETAAQCLKELARVMEQFGIADILDALQDYCQWDGRHIDNPYAALDQLKDTPEKLTLAIAEVEGKPVFIWDELYTPEGEKFFAGEFVDGYICIPGYKKRGGGLSCSQEHCSWNPPKPETVMVELAVEEAEQWAKMKQVGITKIYGNLGEACKKALEQIK